MLIKIICENNEKIKNLKPSNKIIKQLSNGIYRIIMLWEINKQPIHGYGLIKKIDEFYQKQIDEGIVKKTTSSKVYPILSKMEEEGVIEGYWQVKDNKNVKYYKITPFGVEVLNIIHFRLHDVSLNPIWKEFINDMILNEDPIGEVID